MKAGDSKIQGMKTIPGTSRIESKRENTTRRGRTAALAGQLTQDFVSPVRMLKVSGLFVF